MGKRPFRTVVIETNPSGHRLRYVAILADRLSSEDIWLTTSACEDSEEARDHLQQMGMRIVHTSASSRTALLRTAAHLSEGGHVVIPDGDFFLIPLIAARIRGRIPGCKVTVLLMRLSVGTSVRSWCVYGLKTFLAALARITSGKNRVFTLANALKSETSQRGYWVNDPVEPLGADKAPVAAGGVRELLVAGNIDRRKNVVMLVRAIACSPQWRLLVAGKVEQDTLEEIVDTAEYRLLLEQGRIEIIDHHLSRDVYLSTFRRAHAVAGLHSNDAPSGVVAEGVAMGRPCVVSNVPNLAIPVRKSRVGVISRLKAREVKSALDQLAVHYEALADNARSVAERMGTSNFAMRMLDRR